MSTTSTIPPCIVLYTPFIYYPDKEKLVVECEKSHKLNISSCSSTLTTTASGLPFIFKFSHFKSLPFATQRLQHNVQSLALCFPKAH